MGSYSKEPFQRIYFCTKVNNEINQENHELNILTKVDRNQAISRYQNVYLSKTFLYIKAVVLYELAENKW